MQTTTAKLHAGSVPQQTDIFADWDGIVTNVSRMMIVMLGMRRRLVLFVWWMMEGVLMRMGVEGLVLRRIIHRALVPQGRCSDEGGEYCFMVQLSELRYLIGRQIEA